MEGSDALPALSFPLRVQPTSVSRLLYDGNEARIEKICLFCRKLWQRGLANRPLELSVHEYLDQYATVYDLRRVTKADSDPDEEALWCRLTLLMIEFLRAQVQYNLISFRSDDELLQFIPLMETRFLAAGKVIDGCMRYFNLHWIKNETARGQKGLYTVLDLHKMLFRGLYIPQLEKKTRMAVMLSLKRQPSSGLPFSRLMTGTGQHYGAWIRPIYLLTRPSMVSAPLLQAAYALKGHTADGTQYFPSTFSHWTLLVGSPCRNIPDLSLGSTGTNRTCTPITCELFVDQGVNTSRIGPVPLRESDALPRRRLLGYTNLYNCDIQSTATRVRHRMGELYNVIGNNCQAFARGVFEYIRIPSNFDSIFQGRHYISEGDWDNVLHRRYMTFLIMTFRVPRTNSQPPESMPLSVAPLTTAAADTVSLMLVVIASAQLTAGTFFLLITAIALHRARSNVGFTEYQRFISALLPRPVDELIEEMHDAVYLGSPEPPLLEGVYSVGHVNPSFERAVGYIEQIE